MLPVTFFPFMHQTKYRNTNNERSNRMSMGITVDSSKCISCGECTKECHRHLLVSRRADMSSDGVECICCFHCYAVCPHQAIQLTGTIPVLSQETNGDATIDESQLLHFLAFRRSIRRFKAQEVEGGIVEKLIHAASYIPSGGNSHSYQFTVITEGNTRDRLNRELKRIYAKRRRILQSAFLRNLFILLADRQTRAFLQDTTYLKRVSYLLDQYQRGEDPVFYNAPLIIIIHSDALIPTPREDSVLAAYNIVLMAQTLGLGSCFVSFAQNAINANRTCKKILNMSPADRVHAVVVLGYPTVQFRRAIPRELKMFQWLNT